MSDRAYAKAQAQQKTLIGSSPKSSLLQRTCACGQHTLAGGECEECCKKREGTLQHAATGSPTVVQEALRSPGQPLDAATRAFMKPRFEHDFSRVRVHTDARAAESVRAIDVLAYTVGGDVVFGAGQYAPRTGEGHRLIAHVVQQSDSDGIRVGKSNEKRGLSPIGEELQIKAEPATLQRQEAEKGDLLQGQVGATENRTGMPDKLIAGLEQLSGVDLSAVRVHYNSTEPAQLNALAYTHGTDIQIAPGQEKHLPHEGWHVVQQMQGRVKPTLQMKGILLNDNDGLEREADVMGAKAHVLGDQAGAAGFHTRIATASGAGLDDEPFVVAIVPAAQRVASQLEKPTMNTSNVPVIQRVAKFVAGTVSATTNLASLLIAGRRDAGLTPPTLNGTTILSAAAAQGALKPPTLGGHSNADGTVSTWVGTVPTNEASFTMQVPSGGPWSTVTLKASVKALFASLGLAAQAGCSTAGNSTFSVNGKPTDADFAANVRTHEDLHVADHKTGFNTVIVPWDTKLEAAKTAKTVFNGATSAAAEDALFAAMGGKPDQIATAQHNEWLRLNGLTHAGTTVVTGGPATPSNSAANAACTTSSLDLT